MRMNYGSDSPCYGDAASKHYFTVDLVTEILDVADVASMARMSSSGNARTFLASRTSDC